MHGQEEIWHCTRIIWPGKAVLIFVKKVKIQLSEISEKSRLQKMRALKIIQHREKGNYVTEILHSRVRELCNQAFIMQKKTNSKVKIVEKNKLPSPYGRKSWKQSKDSKPLVVKAITQNRTSNKSHILERRGQQQRLAIRLYNKNVPLFISLFFTNHYSKIKVANKACIVEKTGSKVRKKVTSKSQIAEIVNSQSHMADMAVSKVRRLGRQQSSNSKKELVVIDQVKKPMRQKKHNNRGQ